MTLSRAWTSSLSNEDVIHGIVDATPAANNISVH